MLRPCRLAMPLVVLPVAVALAAGAFDGTYSGPNSLLRGEPPTCVAARTVTWTVADGRVSIKYGNVPIAAEIGADGAFRANAVYQAGRTNANATMQGRIAGGALEADIESYACKYHYSLKKQ
jgi:hypothetical protein